MQTAKFASTSSSSRRVNCRATSSMPSMQGGKWNARAILALGSSAGGAASLTANLCFAQNGLWRDKLPPQHQIQDRPDNPSRISTDELERRRPDGSNRADQYWRRFNVCLALGSADARPFARLLHARSAAAVC